MTNISSTPKMAVVLPNTATLFYGWADGGISGERIPSTL